jgi:ribonuclease P protein component
MKGQKIVNPSFVLFSVANNLNSCQFGISTPKKLLKKAVDRNRYKRQIRDMLISHLKKHQDSCQISDKHAHNNFVIIIRYPYLDNDFSTNQKNLYKLLISASQEKSNPRPENASLQKKN